MPLQTNAPPGQLLGIFREVEPRWLAASLDCLGSAVELVLSGTRPPGLLLFDYDPEISEQRAAFEAAQSKLAAHGFADLLQTLAVSLRPRRPTACGATVCRAEHGPADVHDLLHLGQHRLT